MVVESKETESFVWVTAGREIENYVLYNTLGDVVKTVHGNDAFLPSQGRFAKLTKYRIGDKGTWKDFDKVKVEVRTKTWTRNETGGCPCTHWKTG